jgi:hypothetical protein
MERRFKLKGWVQLIFSIFVALVVEVEVNESAGEVGRIFDG